MSALNIQINRRDDKTSEIVSCGLTGVEKVFYGNSAFTSISRLVRNG